MKIIKERIMGGRLKLLRKWSGGGNCFYRGIGVCFFLLAAVQMIAIVYINLTQMPYHMGYDASAYYLKAAEIWKQKTLFISHWAEQTTLELDTSLPLASLFYGMSNHIFFAYGLANCCVIFALAGVFYSILKGLNYDCMVRWICLNFLLCPYITFVDNLNDLGYFACMMTSFQAYGVKVLIILMQLKAMLDLGEQKKNYFYLAVTSVLCFITGLSSGYFVLAVGILPCFCWIIIKMFVNNDIRILKTKQTAYLLVNMTMTVLGKLVAFKILDFAAKDSSMRWMSLTSFWKNIGGMVLGYMQLLSALPKHADVDIMNIKLESISLTYMFCLMLFIIMAGSLVLCIAGMKKRGYSWNINLFLTVLAENILLFSVLYTTYEGSIFESRYLIPSFMAVIVLAGYAIQNLKKDQLFTYAVLAVLLIGLVYVDYNSDKRYIQNKINSQILYEIADKAEETDSGIVYVWGNNLAVEARNLRVYDLERVYKLMNDDGSFHHWGDYTYYDDGMDYAGPTMLICEIGAECVPAEVKEKYELVSTVDCMEIYVAEDNGVYKANHLEK